MVKLLIDNAPDLNAMNKNGNTALLIAINKGTKSFKGNSN